MTTRIADDYEYIKSRMEEIAKERAEQKPEDRSAEPGNPNVTPQTYMGWDIYAPVYLTPSAFNDVARRYMTGHTKCSAAS